MTYAEYFKEKKVVTPQSQPLPEYEEVMIKNAAGGYAFAPSDWTKLNRFLLIGTEGGSYYESEKQMTLANAKTLMTLVSVDPLRVIREIVRISEEGLALSNSPALFALAVVAVKGDPYARRVAYDHLPRVARTGTHLFEFAENVKALRKKLTGRQFKRGISNWYTSQDAKSLAYSVTKYQQRNGWSHQDLIRLGHVHSKDRAVNDVIGYAAGRMEINPDQHFVQREVIEADEYLFAVEVAKTASEPMLLGLIERYNLPREVLPTQALNSRAIWEMLLQKMPYTAMLRNLPKMTELGMFEPLQASLRLVEERLVEVERIRKGRVHPLSILIALKTYGSGVSFRGEKRWTPNQRIVGALDAAFRASFQTVTPLKENIIIALDVSGSMGAHLSHVPNMTSTEAAAAVGLVYAATQPNSHIMVFESRAHDVNINPRGTLEDAMRVVSAYGGGTSMNTIFEHAQAHRYDADGFLIITDSESWSGRQHVVKAWEEYNRAMGPSRVFNVQTVASQTTLYHDTTEAIEAAGFSADMFVMANKFFQHEL